VAVVLPRREQMEARRPSSRVRATCNIAARARDRPRCWSQVRSKASTRPRMGERSTTVAAQRLLKLGCSLNRGSRSFPNRTSKQGVGQTWEVVSLHSVCTWCIVPPEPASYALCGPLSYAKRTNARSPRGARQPQARPLQRHCATTRRRQVKATVVAMPGALAA
jgi:hypothetical protein